MSIPIDIKFRCRNCGNKITMEAWESINTQIPNVAHDIMTGELFAFTCPRCKCQDYVEYDMLYRIAMLALANNNASKELMHTASQYFRDRRGQFDDFGREKIDQEFNEKMHLWTE